MYMYVKQSSPNCGSLELYIEDNLHGYSAIFGEALDIVVRKVDFPAFGNL